MWPISLKKYGLTRTGTSDSHIDTNFRVQSEDISNFDLVRRYLFCFFFVFFLFLFFVLFFMLYVNNKGSMVYPGSRFSYFNQRM